MEMMAFEIVIIVCGTTVHDSLGALKGSRRGCPCRTLG